jgi:hypothetical protein
MEGNDNDFSWMQSNKKRWTKSISCIEILSVIFVICGEVAVHLYCQFC